MNAATDFEKGLLITRPNVYFVGRYEILRYAASLTLDKTWQPPFIKNLFARTSEFLKRSRKRRLAPSLKSAPAPGTKKTKGAGAVIGGIMSQFALVGGYAVEAVALPCGRGVGVRRKRWDGDEADI
jgi:hypothetical protein